MSELEKAVLDKERAESTMRQAVDKYENLTKEKNNAELTWLKTMFLLQK